MNATIDAAQLPAMLTQLRLPTIARLWPAITQTADRESWPAAKTLAALFEHEIAERTAFRRDNSRLSKR
jgi:DNA replication protein DnaC